MNIVMIGLDTAKSVVHGVNAAGIRRKLSRGEPIPFFNCAQLSWRLAARPITGRGC
jgi:hypothetical protein